MLRRSGTELVKCKKSKRKQLSRKEQEMRERQVRAKANRQAERKGGDAEMAEAEENTGKAQRAANRVELGKRSRLEEIARRRGLSLEPVTKTDPVYEVAASQAADHALMQAPRNQRTFQKELAKVRYRESRPNLNPYASPCA